MEMRKVSDRCFEEVLEKSGPVRWPKRFRRLSIALDNLVAVDGGAVETKDIGLADANTRNQLRQLGADGRIVDKRNIMVIDDVDGKLPSFEAMSVTLKPMSDWDGRPVEEKKGHLFLIHGDMLRYEIVRRPAYLCLELPIPEDLFVGLWERVVAKLPLKAVGLSVQADLFQSELEVALGEPWQSQTFGIARDDASEAVVSSLVIQNAPVTLVVPTDQNIDIEDADELPAPPPRPAVDGVAIQLGRVTRMLGLIATLLAILAVAVIFRI